MDNNTIGMVLGGALIIFTLIFSIWVIVVMSREFGIKKFLFIASTFLFWPAVSLILWALNLYTNIPVYLLAIILFTTCIAFLLTIRYFNKKKQRTIANVKFEEQMKEYRNR